MKNIKIVKGKPLPNYVKVQLLEQASILLLQPCHKFICPCICEASNYQIKTYEVFEYIPELTKYRPNEIHSGDVGGLEIWFHPFLYSSKEKRLSIINYTINDIKEAMR
jgi:hypothetical protein